MLCRSFLRSLSCAVFAGACLSAPTLHAQSLTWLGIPAGRTESHAFGISADGSTIVGISNAGARALYWRRGVGGAWEVQELPPLSNSAYNAAYAASANGDLIIGQSGPSYDDGVAALWRPGMAAGALPGIGFYETCRAISRNSRVAAGYAGSGSGYRAVWWDVSGGWVDFLPELVDGTNAAAYATSQDGGLIFGESGRRPCRWTRVGLDYQAGALPVLPNGRGGVVIASAGSGRSFTGWTDAGGAPGIATRWSVDADGSVRVDNLGLISGIQNTIGSGISDDGAVVGGYAYNSFPDPEIYVGTIWTAAAGLLPLRDYLRAIGVNVSGANFRFVYGVSPDGRSLVGSGTNFGSYEAFLVTLPPMPPCFTLDPVRIDRNCITSATTLTVTARGDGPFTYRWRANGVPMNEVTYPSAITPILRLPIVGRRDLTRYDCLVAHACGVRASIATRAIACVADFDDGRSSGRCDGGVTIDDLVYYISLYAEASIFADIDDGTGTGTPDGGVSLDDLAYFLERYYAGC